MTVEYLLLTSGLNGISQRGPAASEPTAALNAKDEAFGPKLPSGQRHSEATVDNQ